MGFLDSGKWHDKWYNTGETAGKFVREDSQFRQSLSKDLTSDFPMESGRYHLYVSHACPWAHRTMIFRSLKGLKDHISVSVVHPLMKQYGWEFDDSNPAYHDYLYNSQYMYELYLKAKPTYSGRVTVPVLWDKTLHKIVNNESSEIIRMFNNEFNELTGNTVDYYPLSLRDQIDSLNERIYHGVNNGVYKCGFATTQSAYDEAIIPLFDCLSDLDSMLATQPYLCGNVLTEADWRLFTTLLRFDPVYVVHFKCNVKMIAEFSYLSQYVQRLRAIPGIEETIVMEDIKDHYFQSHNMINPSGIVPARNA